MLLTKSQKRKPHTHTHVSQSVSFIDFLYVFFVVDCGTRGTKKVKKIMSNAPTIEESQKKTVVKNFRSMTRSGSLQFQIHRYLLQLQLEIESHEKKFALNRVCLI